MLYVAWDYKGLTSAKIVFVGGKLLLLTQTLLCLTFRESAPSRLLIK